MKLQSLLYQLRRYGDILLGAALFFFLLLPAGIFGWIALIRWAVRSC